MAEQISEAIDREHIAAIIQKRRAGQRLSIAERNELRRYETRRDDAERARLLTAVPQKTLCALLDSSRKMLREWEAAGMPRKPDSSYDLYQVLVWLKARWLQDKHAPSPEEEQWLVLRQKCEAKLKELDLAEREGQLIEASEVERTRVQQVLEVRRQLDGLPRALAPKLAGLDVAAIHGLLEDECRRICESFARDPGPAPDVG